MFRIFDSIFGVAKDSRNSTKYSTRAGWTLIMSAILFTFVGVISGAVTSGIFVDIIWAYFITAGAMFGINAARVTTENVRGTVPWGTAERDDEDEETKDKDAKEKVTTYKVIKEKETKDEEPRSEEAGQDDECAEPAYRD